VRVSAHNYVGKKINNIEIVLCFRKNNKTFFNCICFCEKNFVSRSDSILSETTKSCGCISGFLISKKTSKRNNANQINSLYGSYKANALKRKVIFNLSLDEFKEIIVKNCHYCGAKPFQKWMHNKKRKHYFNQPILYNGIDQVMPGYGYYMDNVNPCCHICNRAKHNSSYSDFINWINRIIKKYGMHENVNSISSVKEILLIDINFQSKNSVESGDTFGFISVLGKNISGSKLKTYNCLCVCGSIVHRDKYDLINGLGKSCGCKKGILNAGKTTKLNGYAQYMHIYNRYKRGALIRNIKFSLSFDEFKSIIINACNYCGKEPYKFSTKGFGGKGICKIDVYANGIDRVNSDEHYADNNCVSCCAICNFAKGSLSLEQFAEYVDRLKTKYL